MDGRGKSVGIFRMNFPENSETFIRSQLNSYKNYKPRIYAKRQLSESEWPVNSVSKYGVLAEYVYLASRSTHWHCLEQGRSPNLMHAHFGVDGVYALPLADRLGIPLVTTFHGFDILTNMPWWLKHLSIPIAVYLMHLSELKANGAAFIAVSRFVEQALIKAGFPKHRIKQHYIGVDTNKFHPIKREASSARYVLSVGRHVEVKGIDILLRAFARIKDKHPDVRLLQIGTGPLSSTLASLAEALGLKNRVTFLGMRPHEEVISLIQGADVFALPSVTQNNGRAEALGIVFNEASACAVPIVSTFSGGIPEVVLDGETGLLCQERDDLALSENLDILLQDSDLRTKLGKRGRELVCECFDLERQTHKLEAIYDEIVS